MGSHGTFVNSIFEFIKVALTPAPIQSFHQIYYYPTKNIKVKTPNIIAYQITHSSDNCVFNYTKYKFQNSDEQINTKYKYRLGQKDLNFL